MFKHPTAYNHRIFGVGVNVAIAKISHLLQVAMSAMPTKNTELKHRRYENGNLPRQVDVFVASFGKTPLSERLQVCTDLWHGLVYLHDINILVFVCL
jgi:hypothetical protein